MRKYSLQADILVRGYYGWNSRRALQVLTEVFPKVLYYFIGQINGSLLLIDVVVCGLTCFMSVKYSFFVFVFLLVSIRNLEASCGWIDIVCKAWNHVAEKYSPGTQGDEKWNR